VLRCAVLRCAARQPATLPLPSTPPHCLPCRAADKDCRLCFYLENVRRQAAEQQLVTGKQPCTGRCKALTKRQRSRMYRAGKKGDFSSSSYESYQQAGPMRPPTSGGPRRLTSQQLAERQAAKEERTRLGNQYLEEKRQREAAAAAAAQPGRGSSSSGQAQCACRWHAAPGAQGGPRPRARSIGGTVPCALCLFMHCACLVFRAPESYGSGPKMAGPRQQIDTHEAAQLRRRSRAI
jgi:hypothetical protein